MTTPSMDQPKLERLIALVVQDIQNKGLRPGDRYMTTQEVASQLHIGTRTANDALRILAERKIVERKPKAGTTIGPEAPCAPSVALDVAHLMIRQNYFFSERSRMERLMTGLARELPGTSIQFTFVPAFQELAYAQRLVKSMSAAKQRAGYLIAVKSPQMQDFFQRQQLPAVLLGTPFAGIVKLPWIDKDQGHLGKIIARRLIELGHRKIAVMLRDRRGHGDDLFIDSIMHEIMDANLGSGALVIRSAPSEEDLTENAIRELLVSPSRPTALICSTRQIYEAANTVCTTLSLNPRSDVQLALRTPTANPKEMVPAPGIQPRVDTDDESEGRMLGRMLASFSREEWPDPDHFQIPVYL